MFIFHLWKFFKISYSFSGVLILSSKLAIIVYIWSLWLCFLSCPNKFLPPPTFLVTPLGQESWIRLRCGLSHCTADQDLRSNVLKVVLNKVQGNDTNFISETLKLSTNYNTTLVFDVYSAFCIKNPKISNEMPIKNLLCRSLIKLETTRQGYSRVDNNKLVSLV